ncbi:DUF4105 domain-containing protein [Dokdonella sp.]|uniref:lipoprotein N-acyltransferase Lnb domain-containing protein n=1 Tax=Dokdonella sp. TaxID=2291710 RepID=UPI0025C40F6A|nr:DUF4105 domain-containing protein [Dokdonella sp.]MBX3688425.1 DUF4105 domain-containing protein [Dokdonella sp.]
MKPERGLAARPARRAAARASLWYCLIALLLSLALPGATARAQALPPETDAAAPAISLLTVGPGEIYFERFGHNAIVVRDGNSDHAVAYNYGMFDFEQENFLLNFVRGHMLYRIAASLLDDDLAMYRAEGRSVTEQALDLTPDEARALNDYLIWNARPENAWYRYDYFKANCSTRVRDALDQALGGLIHAQSVGRSRGYTYRLDALRLMAPDPTLMLLIDLGLGPYTDQRIDFWDESFVPMTLQHVVARVHRADGRPLVSSTRELAASRIAPPPALPPDLRLPFLFTGLAAALAMAWLDSRGPRARRVFAAIAALFELLCAITGCLLLFLWLGTDHRAAWRNENLLLFNPACLLLSAVFLRRRPASRWQYGLAWLIVAAGACMLASKILPDVAQSNLQWILLVLPLHLVLALRIGQRQVVSTA